jgi:hypothetical protein
MSWIARYDGLAEWYRDWSQGSDCEAAGDDFPRLLSLRAERPS